MGLRILTNVSALAAQNRLDQVTRRLQGNYARLSSGLRIASAGDDAAGLGISERMRARLRSLDQAGRNTQDGIGLLRTAEGALTEVSGMLVRMRELAVQAANGTLNRTDRRTLDDEFQSLKDEIDRIGATSAFNGVHLLDGSRAALDVQVGAGAGEVISIDLEPVDRNALRIQNLRVRGRLPIRASRALAGLDQAIDQLSALRGSLAAAEGRLGSAAQGLAVARVGLAAAESRIRDVDVAAETADLSRNTIQQLAAVSVLAQANVQPLLVLSLLE